MDINQYRVARHPQHGILWFAPGYPIPSHYLGVRAATPEEEALMRRIDKYRDPPLALVAQLEKMIEA